MSKNYDVTLPITGTIVVSVDADSEEDAIEKALHCNGLISDNIESWEVHERICRGNVLYAELNEAFAELAFGEEPDE